MHVTTLLILISLAVYFALLSVVSRRSRGTADNDAFFRADRRSPWWMVAFGMVGASISGVSFVSVPGWVRATGMTYLQMCIGFIVGYAVVAGVLLPLYYRAAQSDDTDGDGGAQAGRATTIYEFLRERFGSRTHSTGALFFVLSKLTGAAARLYLTVIVLHTLLRPSLPGGFWQDTGGQTLTGAVVLLLIWLYTRRGGLRTIVRTDALQTACMLLALLGVTWAVASQMQLNVAGVWRTIAESDMSRVFEWDAGSRQAFWRQFLSGVFIVVVMTGLDQDMMQKNLTCRTLREAQKNMCSYGLAFLPVNALLLGLGVLLYAFCAQNAIAPPERSDALLPMLVAGGWLGQAVVVPFTVGIVSSAFSSADSAIAALTTSVCVDLLGVERTVYPAERAERMRKHVHIAMFGAFFVCMMLFGILNSTSVIDTIYVMASYTYGPLLGLYCFGMWSKLRVRDRFVPAVCIAAPFICALLDHFAPLWWGYTFGYELLVLNGLLTAFGLFALSTRAAR